MKSKKVELDVDFIGGQEPLTLAEEKAISDFFKQRKLSKQMPEKVKKIVKPKQIAGLNS